MIINEQSPKQMLKNTRTMFLAMMVGQILFLSVVLLINETKLVFNLNLTDPFIILVIILSLTSMPISYIYSKFSFKKIDKNESLKDRLIKYQSGLIIRLASCEGIGLFSIVLLLLTSNTFFLIVLMIALFVMIQYFPTPEKIGREINLTLSEINKFSE